MFRAVASAAGNAIASHLEEQARANAGNAAGVNTNGVLWRNQRETLEKDVSARMRTYELKSIEDSEASVAGLYIHFFWSIIALVECCLWFGIYSAAYALTFVIYYLQKCLSCGKGCTKECDEQMREILRSISRRWGYYFITPTFLLGNIIMPWSPPLYFYKRYDKLYYPNNRHSTYRELTRETREQNVPCLCWCCYKCTDSCMDEEEGCCACGGVEKHDIPSYMSVGRHLIVVGCGDACQNIDDDDVVLERARKVMEADTEKFYTITYGGVKNFEELYSVRNGGGGIAQPGIVQGQPVTSSAHATSAAYAVPVEAEVISHGERSALNKA